MDDRNIVELDRLRKKADDGGSGGTAFEPPPPLEPCTISQVIEVFTHWLLLPDLTPVYAVLGTIAANLLEGDPVWLGLIAPPSSAKTEVLNSLSRLPYVFQASTLTPAALLSGTPKKQHDKAAKGGLLRRIGSDLGIISLKDFGSILSMRPDTKGEVLAALREIYDGTWTRELGVDGGRTLSWKGKVGIVFGATAVIDTHYAVLGAMGDRFLISRLVPADGQFLQALKHSGAAAAKMRAELSEAVARLFAAPRRSPRECSSEEVAQLDHIVSLVVRLRGAIERDRASREVEAVYGAEGSARIGLALAALLAGLDTLGVDRATAFGVVEAVAMDSTPPIRRHAYEFLKLRNNSAKTSEIAEALRLPTNTVRRALEDLTAYDLIGRTAGGEGKPDTWNIKEGSLL
jgi:FaeA-like protein